MKISKFQIITLALFLLFLVGGVTAFALYKGDQVSTSLPPVTIWGTFPQDTFDLYVSQINNTLAQPLSVTYVEKRPSEFSSDFVSALARGTGPDGILIPADMLLPHYDKVAYIPYSALDRRVFMDSYIDQAQIYLTDEGSLAVPFTIDPLVMYWNRDIFNATGIATYPRYWDEFTDLNKRITQKDQNGNIRKSLIALGDFSNINNAREILGTLIMQVGNPITTTDFDGFAVSTIKISASVSPLPALEFFTKFVNPNNPDYSWNRGMPASKPAFLSGTLATYFGFASEIFDIRSKNPNLNFDVAPIPQVRTGGIKASYARLNGISIVRSSPVPNAVYQVASILTDPNNLIKLSQTMYLPTVRRDIISAGSSDPYIGIFNQSALISKTWLDADPVASANIFAQMIESITSGAKTSFQAIQDAGDEYDVVLENALK